MKQKLLLFVLVTVALLSAQSGHFNQFTWTAPTTGDPPTGYNVYRAPSATGTFTLLGSVAAPTLTYSDSTVVAGQLSVYQVTAYNPGGESVPSNQVTCTTPFQKPGAPGGLSGIAH